MQELLLIALIPIVLFGILNIVGIREPAFIVFIIAAFHFSLLLFIDIKGLIMAFERQVDFMLVFKDLPKISPSNMLLGFATAFLGITGFESAAQIVEQLKSPSWRTLKKIYLVIVSLVTITAPLTSLLCLTLLTSEEIAKHKDHLLSGLALVEGGTPLLQILVADAALTLFAAVNTAYVGCIGLCTTMAKQGNLPAIMLRRWDLKVPLLQGYPYVVLPFMAITGAMMFMLPGRVDQLGQVYGMAFLAVMSTFCLGVVLLRFKMPKKVERAPFKSKLTFDLAGKKLPLAPVLGGAALLIAEITLISNADKSRDLGLEILLVILLFMCLYRLGVLEERLEELSDLRLGLGKFKDMDELPKDLPVYVLCTAGAKARRLTLSLIRLLDKEEPGPKEIVIYHAEEETARRGIMYELLQRVVSQQIAPNFADKDIILTVKIMPAKLIDGLISLKRSHRFDKVFIGQANDPDQSEEYARNLEDNLGVPVVVMGNIFKNYSVPLFAKPEDP